MACFLRPKTTGTYRLGFDALDGDVMKITFADPYPEAYRVPSRDLHPRGIYGGGAPVSLANLPTKMRISGNKKQLVDFNSAYHMYLVSRRFVDLVERFQTDIQYIPVECTWKDGNRAGDFYFFFTTVRLDAVVAEQTTATWQQATPERGFWRPELYNGETFTFDKARLGGAHMWVDPNMPEEGALISDALFVALKEAKVECFYDTMSFAEV